jgi:hypothetical protein
MDGKDALGIDWIGGVMLSLAFCEGDGLGLRDKDVTCSDGLGLGDSDTLFDDGLGLGDSDTFSGDKDVIFGDCDSGRFEDEVGKDDWLFGEMGIGNVGDDNKGKEGGGNKLRGVNSRDVPDDDGETPEETVWVASVKGKLLSSKTTCLDRYTRPVVKSKQR